MTHVTDHNYPMRNRHRTKRRNGDTPVAKPHRRERDPDVLDADVQDIDYAGHLAKALDRHMPFGKYSGCTLGQILEMDPEYLRWLDQDANLREGTLRCAISLIAAEHADRLASAQPLHRSRRQMAFASQGD